MYSHLDFYKDDLPEYTVIRRALCAAVTDLLNKDFDLLALGGHEQAMAHRIAVYLEPLFPAFQVDCEYNRRKHKAKARPAESNAPRSMRPDIIVHHRNTPRNVLAIEMKAKAHKGSKSDLAKLAVLKAEKGYLYKGVAFVCIKNDIRSMADGCLRAVVSWYDVAADRPIERDSERETLVCDKHRDEVKQILKKRQLENK